MGMVKTGDERPVIGADAWLLQAYAELSTCRAGGMSGVPPIPWVAIAQYAEMHSLDDEFIQIILIADTEFTTHINKDDKGGEVNGRQHKGNKSKT